MSDRLCPTCAHALDPLRAKVAKIVGGRVVTYCSEECARGEARREPTLVVMSAVAPIDVATAVPPPVPEPPPPSKPSGEVEPAAVPAHRELDRPPRRRSQSSLLSRRQLGILALVGGIALLGLVVAVMPALSPSRPAPAAAATPAPAQAEVAQAPPPAAPEPLAILHEAQAVLSGYLGDSSGRIRLLAASALARTGDPAAMTELGKLLDTDPSAIRRLEIAFALARSGDARGMEHLVSSLGGERRDVRLEAARALARLRDGRGRGHLRSALRIPSLRLSAAETLACLGDSEATTLLKQALSDANNEPRMRAAVALGRAGDASGLALLKDVSAQNRVELGAAEALARLGERDAIPALERALALSALRVEAAVALRRLSATPELGALRDALSQGDEVGRISAAEALVVLLGPEPPAELK